MKKFLIIIFIFFSVSCSTKDDNVDTCTQDCTTIEGKILSDNSIPISDVEIEFSYNERSELTSYDRIIGRGKTNQNGEFIIKTYLDDSELGYTDGSFKIIILQDKLEDIYFKSSQVKEIEHGLFSYIAADYEKYLNNIFSRDTLIKFNPIIPKKKSITVKIQGFQPILDTDKIVLKNSVIINNQDADFSVSSGSSIFSKYDQENIIIDMVGANNFLNKIAVEKRKNGDFEHETYNIENNQNQIIIEY